MDFYAVLGVSRAATSGDIERAYRRLARRYHPGVNPGDRFAEDLYRQVQAAYGVLADAERRRDYDRGAEPVVVGSVETTVSFDGFDFSSPAEGPLAATFSELFADVFQDAAREATAPTRGGDLELTVRVPFEDAVRGGQVPISVVRQERCPSCLGVGHVARAPVMCPACQGEGSRRWARGHMVFTKACELCGGDGRIVAQPCRACQGAGVLPRSEVVTVPIAVGVETGTRLAVPGRGHAGARGGPAGDLYLTLEVAEHAWFTRAGRDLQVTVPVAVHEAALGAKIDVPTLDEPVSLRIPPGTAAGQRLRVRGRGLPATPSAEAGDLLVDVQIVLPPVRDERSREILREFAALNPIDARRHFFSREGQTS